MIWAFTALSQPAANVATDPGMEAGQLAPLTTPWICLYEKEGVMNRVRVLRQFTAALVGIWGIIAAVAANAAPLAAPLAKPILTISGKIASTNKDDTAQFDRAML